MLLKSYYSPTFKLSHPHRPVVNPSFAPHRIKRQGVKPVLVNASGTAVYQTEWTEIEESIGGNHLPFKVFPGSKPAISQTNTLPSQLSSLTASTKPVVLVRDTNAW